MAKEKEVKKESKAKSLLKVYLLNGAHLDVPVDSHIDPRIAAEALAERGVWGAERAEEFFYPPSQIFRIRVKVEK